MKGTFSLLIRICLFHGQNRVYELLSYLFPGTWIELHRICSPLSHHWFFQRKSLFFLSVMKITKKSHQFPPESEGNHATIACGHARRCLGNVQIWWLVTKTSVVTSWVTALLVSSWCRKGVNIVGAFLSLLFFSLCNEEWKFFVSAGISGSPGTLGRSFPTHRAALNIP